MFHVEHQGDNKRSVPDTLTAPPEGAAKVFGTRLDLAVRYGQWLAREGIQRGLIGPREVPRLWPRHILNSAVVEEIIQKDIRVIDVGSGAGLPGIPLAIARPDLHVQLIEPLLRRTVFLEAVVADLNLSNVEVIRGRAEDKGLVKAVGGADVVTSRAVAPLGTLTQWSLPLLRRGSGMMRALKGASAHEEVHRDAAQITAAGGGETELLVVGAEILEEPTHVVCIRRIS